MLEMKIINGSNNLIIEGEKCIRNALDILNYYPNNKFDNKKIIVKEKINVPENMLDVYETIDKKGKNIDDICKELKCNVSDILFKLTMLEMSGLIIQCPGKIFLRK